DSFHASNFSASAVISCTTGPTCRLITSETRTVSGVAVMQLGIVALHAHGYRSLTSRPGHHQTATPTLTLTAGLAANQMIVIDGLRNLRNLSDYCTMLFASLVSKD
ncbi:MAG: hypothetical protein CVU63_00535, partial [Deltaproteobacteria bacterium HGW-Deltaproteobacteria-20]